MLSLIAAEMAPRRAALAYLTLLMASATVCVCQTPAGQEAAPHPAFEVASVKVNNSGAFEFNATMSLGRYVATNVPLRRLIRDAYLIKVFQIENLPSWDPGQRFDINAKMPANIKQGDLQWMLQDLLAKRFGLVLRREMKETTVYSLVVGKTGPRLGEKITGSVDRRFNANPGLLKGNATMVELSAFLSADLQSVVTDKTGLEGAYAIDLKYVPEPVDGPVPAATPYNNGLTGPSLSDAIQTLGLKLERQKGTIPVYYVEHVLKVPTEN